MTNLLFFLSFHIISCIWILIVNSERESGEENWVDKYYNEDGNPENIWIYVSGIYYVTATATTIAYGDINSYSIYERSYCIFQ